MTHHKAVGDLLMSHRRVLYTLSLGKSALSLR